MLNKLGYNDTSSLASSDGQSYLSLIRIDSWFQFSNFHLYSFTALGDFVTFYALMMGLIMATLFGIFLFADSMYKKAKTNDIHDSTLFLVQLFSLMLVAMMYVFEIPIITVLFQGFICGEDHSETSFAISGN